MSRPQTNGGPRDLFEFSSRGVAKEDTSKRTLADSWSVGRLRPDGLFVAIAALRRADNSSQGANLLSLIHI